MTMNKKNIGSDFNDFLRDQGIYDEVHALALKEVFAAELRGAMESAGLTEQALAARRKVVLENSHKGILPNHLPPSVATESDWRIELPDWCADQRNQMTGPSDDAELVVKMLNSGAPGVMLDLEDSTANFWPNLTLGIANVLSALRGELTYYDQKRGGEVAIKESKTVIWTRARGLHLSQAGLFPDRDELTSASLFDVAMIVYQVDPSKLKHPLSFYVPKTEAAEANLSTIISGTGSASGSGAYVSVSSL
jgi:malate synthase